MLIRAWLSLTGRLQIGRVERWIAIKIGVCSIHQVAFVNFGADQVSLGGDIRRDTVRNAGGAETTASGSNNAADECQYSDHKQNGGDGNTRIGS